MTQQFHAWLFAQQNVNIYFQKVMVRTSLVVQWLRLHSPYVGGPCSIPNGGTRSHMPQLRVHMLKPKILHAKMTQHSQKRKEDRVVVALFLIVEN